MSPQPSQDQSSKSKSSTHPLFTPEKIEDVHGNPNSTEYGFVVNHPAYWGLPIPGFDKRKPTEPDPPSVENLSLKVEAKIIDADKTTWNNGQIRVLATRMPPLFHALHHNTLVHAPKSFIPRDERGDLPEAGERALVGLCNLDFDSKGKGEANVIAPTIPIKKFSKEPDDGRPLIQRAKDWGYFEVESKNGFVWDPDKVGPLGALWIVLLNENGTPAWFDEHLGGGYRMWHYKNEGNLNFFEWEFRQSEDKKEIQIIVEIGVSTLGLPKPDEEGYHPEKRYKWKEQVKLKLNLTWV